MAAPHCTNILHNETSCIAANLPRAEWCDACEEWYSREELSVDNAADYDFTEYVEDEDYY